MYLGPFINDRHSHPVAKGETFDALAELFHGFCNITLEYDRELVDDDNFRIFQSTGLSAAAVFWKLSLRS